jgi:mRNA interferase RelE/StbE
VTPRYRIELTREALRALAKLDKPVRRRVQGAIDRLADDPHPAGMIALRGAPGAFRIRVGDYRVIYVLHDDLLLVVVIDIGHRRDVYRNV